MDKFNRLSGTMKATCIVALALVMTGALVLLAAEKAAVEKAERGFLGVSVQRLDGADREKLGVAYGVQVAHVEKDSAAAKAGILEDDVIQSVNGEKVRDPQTLIEIVRELAPGSTVKIGIWRGGKSLELSAALGKRERPERSHWSVGPLVKHLRSGPYLGVNIMDLDNDLAAYFSVKAGEGILVTKVEKDTPAAKAGLKSGDVIVQMGDKPVKDSGDIHESLAALKKGDSIVLTVVRHGKKETLKAEPDFSRHERVLRIFGGDKDMEIEHLELPDLNVDIPEFEIEPPCPPDPPDLDEVLHKVHEQMDHVRFKVGKQLKKIAENSWI